MSKRGPILIDDDDTVPDVHDGWQGADLMIPDSLIDDLQSLHLFGTSFPSVFATDSGVTDQTVGDHSLNGRTLTKFGTSPAGVKSFTSSAADYYLEPIVGADIQGTDGSFSAFCVANFPNTTGEAVGSWNFGTLNDGWAIGRALTFGGRYNVSTTYLGAGVGPTTTPAILTDGYTGTGYEFLGVTYDVPNLLITLYRMKPGAAMQVATGPLLTAIWAPPVRICWGRSGPPATNFVGGSALVSGGLISKVVDAAEMAALQALQKAFLAGYGVTI